MFRFETVVVLLGLGLFGAMAIAADNNSNGPNCDIPQQAVIDAIRAYEKATLKAIPTLTAP